MYVMNTLVHARVLHPLTSSIHILASAYARRIARSVSLTKIDTIHAQFHPITRMRACALTKLLQQPAPSTRT
jgi:hypothetical protein